MYGRLPEWMRRWRAKELLSLKGYTGMLDIFVFVGPVSCQTNLATSFALVGLLAGVHPLVDCECRPLNKLFAAAGIVADVRSNTTMDALWECG